MSPVIHAEECCWVTWTTLSPKRSSHHSFVAENPINQLPFCNFFLPLACGYGFEARIVAESKTHSVSYWNVSRGGFRQVEEKDYLSFRYKQFPVNQSPTRMRIPTRGANSWDKLIKAVTVAHSFHCNSFKETASFLRLSVPLQDIVLTCRVGLLTLLWNYVMPDTRYKGVSFRATRIYCY